MEQLKIRLSDLEQRIPARTYATASPAVPSEPTEPDAVLASSAPAMANLKSLIEQELQETAIASTQASHSGTAKAETPATAQAQAKKQPTKNDGKQTYVVKKGDTLSKIAQQFYGSPKKWRRIVEANKDKLGQSQILKAGMTLVIPQEN